MLLRQAYPLRQGISENCTNISVTNLWGAISAKKGAIASLLVRLVSGKE
ncbi:MAG: hypothetical protein V7K27_29655 [Nostoc sp.]